MATFHFPHPLCRGNPNQNKQKQNKPEQNLTRLQKTKEKSTISSLLKSLRGKSLLVAFSKMDVEDNFRAEDLFGGAYTAFKKPC